MLSLFHYANFRLFLDGMLAMMALYLLANYYQHRKAIYLSYFFYMIFMLSYITLRDHKEILDVNGFWYKWLTGALQAFAVVLYNIFADMMMDIKHNSPKSHRILRWMSIVLLFNVLSDTVLLLIDAPPLLVKIIFIGVRAFLVYGTIYIVPKILRLNHPVTKYFIIGTSFYVAGSFTALMSLLSPTMFGFNPINAFSYPLTFMEIGVIIETLFFTLGIARRNQIVESEKIKYQARMIEEMQLKENKMAELLRIRDEIARDLHDEVGATLSSISMLSVSALRALPNDLERGKMLLENISKNTLKTLENIDDIVWAISPREESFLNTINRMREYAITVSDTKDIQLKWQIDPQLDSINVPMQLRRNLYLIFKETVNNAAKHSKCTELSVGINLKNNNLDVLIKDNGEGFDQEENSNRNGLKNLRQRSKDIKGNLTIDTSQGTKVSLIIPV